MMELISQHDKKVASPIKQKLMLTERNFAQVDLSSSKTKKEKQSKDNEEGLDLSGCSSDDEFEEESDNDNKLKYNNQYANQKRENSLDINKSQISVNMKDKRNIDNGLASHQNPPSASQNNLISIYDEEEQEMRKNIISSVPSAIPIITSQYSLKPDMMFGWKPQINITGAPIPLYFDYEWFDIPINPATNEEFDISFYGNRFKDSLEMHKAFANRTSEAYKFKFPPNMNVLDAMSAGQRRKRQEQPREFTGMNPILLNQQGIINPKIFTKPSLIFDSRFECGNLDMAIQIRDNEYDLYMRVDSNTRGHHQWFNFIVNNNSVKGVVKFNIVNFTKNASLYHQGMKINIQSQRMQEISKLGTSTQIENEGWVKGGENIQYKLSKLSQISQRSRKYFQLSFEYDFQFQNDKVQFSYSVPYTFSRLFNLLKQVNKDHQAASPELSNQFVKESQLCKSISGLEVPMLTVTSRVNKSNFEEIDNYEFLTSEVESESSPPLNKYKKYIIICSRVHPGETNASFIMEGFIKFITSPTNPEAIELRKRIIFKIIPMTNPDGVIVGNYRTGLCGNDLNRQFITPNTKLHPTVCSIKALVSDIISNAKEPEPISSFIDIHGHSRKKSIFIYGPYFPLHNERYLKMRVLPKLLSERTEMFRFFSCKFRIQKSKLKAARVVLWKEFGIMNCFTLEASFHGFINKERQTIALTAENLRKMGDILGSGFYEYQTLVEEDDKQKLLLKQQIKNKKKRMKAKDIVYAYTKQQEQQIQGINKPTLVSNDQFLSSDQDDKKLNSNINDRAHSQIVIKQGNKEQQLQKSSNIQSNIQKRTQSLGLRDQNASSQNKRFDSCQPSFISNNENLEIIVDTVSEVKRSSAEQSSKNSIYKNDDVNSSFRDPFEDINNAKKKPFRIKKIKGQPIGLPKKENVSEKRTLKSIYKLLKRDIKTMSVPQNGIQGGIQPSNDQRTNQNISSDSEDSDNEDLDCCENEDSDGNDDLTPSELEELQNNIIEAIENFDKIYNKNSVKGKKGKKKSTNKSQKLQQDIQQNLKSLQIEQNNTDEIQKIINSQNQKDSNSSKSKQKQILNSQFSQQQQQAVQMINKYQIKKSQNSQSTNQQNSTRIKSYEQQQQASQFQKYIMQQSTNNHNTNLMGNQSLFKQGGNMLLNERGSLMSNNPLQVSGIVVRSNQQFNQSVQNQRQQYLQELNKSNPSQKEILYQGISQNVRNLIKFVNPQIANINQRNQLIQGNSQLLIQSKSQDKYFQGENNSTSKNDEVLIKSFENFQQKLQSKSSNNRQSNYQNRSQIHESLQRSQIIENNQKVLGVVSIPSLTQNQNSQNSRIGQTAQSKSSRLIFGNDQERSERGSIKPIVSLNENKFVKNSQLQSIKTPTGSFLQNQGALILGTPKKDREETNDSNQSKSLRAYSFSSHLNDAAQSKQNIFQEKSKQQYEDAERGNNRFYRKSQNQPASQNYKSDNEPNTINQQNVFRQNIFRVEQGSINSLQFPQQNQNQNLIIQNIIIGNYHNDQRIQINSPHSAVDDRQEFAKKDSFKEEIIQKHKKKRRKSKRKSKDKKGNNFPQSIPDTNHNSNQQNVKSQYHILGSSTVYPSELQRNSFIGSQVQHQNVGKVQGLKYIGLPNQSSNLNPYQENLNFDRRRKNIQQQYSANHTQNQSNLFMSDGEIEDNHKFMQKRPSEKSQQPQHHQKKLSIEYDQIIRNQEKDNSILGPTSIYNLRPLKDMITTNLNQVKYQKNLRQPYDQPQTIIQKRGVPQGQQVKNQTFYQKQGNDPLILPMTTESGRLSKQPNIKATEIRDLYKQHFRQQ